MAGFSMLTPATTTCAVALIFFIFFSVCYVVIPTAPVAAALSFDYSTFGPDVLNKDIIRLEGDAGISNGCIHVTKNYTPPRSPSSSIENSRGRASYNAEPVLLWDRDTGEVASFTTRFSFSINPVDDFGGNNNKGTGMAFFIAGYPSRLPEPSDAYNMGLTNQSADAMATGDARFVAVEFDTFNDTVAHDPDTAYDHVGIDVNSIRSVATTATMKSFSLIGDMTAEVRYDGRSGKLEMTLWLRTSAQDRPYYVSTTVDLQGALPENVSVGFSGSTTTSVELHQVCSWYFSSSLEHKPAGVLAPPPGTSESVAGRGGVIAGGTVGAALVLVLLFAMAALFARRRRTRSNKRRQLDAQEAQDIGGCGSDSDDDDGVEPNMDDDIEMGAGPRRFPYQELVAATRGFAPEEKLGQGGFGSVYRGHLDQLGEKEKGLAVAIKRFAKGSSNQGRKEYTSEIKVISRLRHRNLVQLVGWCHGRDELLLVYELVPNRSLDVHLHGDGTFLTWPMRVKIMHGLGSALLYLHEEWEQCVVHRDVKPSNVMLDESFCAKLGDFGLARLIDHGAGVQTMTAVSGTPGYVDPDCLITGQASAESDVYSFGVVVLEVACGRRPMSSVDGAGGGGVLRLVEWAWNLYGQGAALTAVDQRLRGEYDAAEAERVVAVGLWCAHPDPRARPSVREAMAALQFKGPVPALPAKMPVATYVAPVVSPEDLFSYRASTSGMTSSGLTQLSTTTTATAHTSCSSDSSTSTGLKDSSSLLKHQY